MKQTIKKIASVFAGLCLGLTVLAQNAATPHLQFSPLLSGYNVLVLSNIIDGVTGSPGVGIGTTNVVFTTYAGQILYSLTNNVVNGVVNTNLTTKDAFQTVKVLPDVNGDINANAAIWYMFNNTNYIPIAVTNSFGQYFVTNWPLAQSQYPNWMYPGSTTLYPYFSGSASNAITVQLFKQPSGRLNGSSVGPTIPFWETTSTFSFSVVLSSATTPVVGSTNLPVGWLQGGNDVTAVIILPANMSTNAATTGVLLNQLGLLQPVP